MIASAKGGGDATAGVCLYVWLLAKQNKSKTYEQI